MKFYAALVTLLLIVAANNYTSLAIATLHEEMRLREMMLHHLHPPHAEKIEPKVELGTE